MVGAGEKRQAFILIGALPGLVDAAVKTAVLSVSRACRRSRKALD